MNNKASNKHSDARSFEMRRLIFLGAAGVLILVVVILSLLSAFGGKSDGQSTGNGQTIDVTDTAVLGENGGVPTLTIEGSGVVYTRGE